MTLLELTRRRSRTVEKPPHAQLPCSWTERPVNYGVKEGALGLLQPALVREKSFLTALDRTDSRKLFVFGAEGQKYCSGN